MSTLHGANLADSVCHISMGSAIGDKKQVMD